jgi:hypothetical protein
MKKTLTLAAATLLTGLYFMASSFQASAESIDFGALETSFNNCGGYVKPATCMAQPHCTWRGSCVPR